MNTYDKFLKQHADYARITDECQQTGQKIVEDIMNRFDIDCD